MDGKRGEIAWSLTSLAIAHVRHPQILAPRVDERDERSRAIHVQLHLAVVAHDLLLALDLRDEVALRARGLAGDDVVVDDRADLGVG